MTAYATIGFDDDGPTWMSFRPPTPRAPRIGSCSVANPQITPAYTTVGTAQSGAMCCSTRRLVSSAAPGARFAVRLAT